MKPYSVDLREKIISVYEAGNTSIRKVAERFKVNKNTVQDLVKRKREKGTRLAKCSNWRKTEPTIWL